MEAECNPVSDSRGFSLNHQPLLFASEHSVLTTYSSPSPSRISARVATTYRISVTIITIIQVVIPFDLSAIPCSTYFHTHFTNERPEARISILSRVKLLRKKELGFRCWTQFLCSSLHTGLCVKCFINIDSCNSSVR